MSNTTGSINLLPEVKVLKLRGQKNKRLATVITIMLGLVFAGVITGLIVVSIYYAAEGRTLKNESTNLQRDVDKYHNTELEGATLQEHLSSFSTLNANRIQVTAVFGQLVKTIPPNVSLNSFQLNSDYSATIAGTTDSFKTLGTFTKALEDYNVTFKQQSGFDRAPIFTNVAITNAAKDTASANGVTFSIGFSVDKKVLEKNKNADGSTTTISPSNADQNNQTGSTKQ